jgi:hypothetical protein
VAIFTVLLLTPSTALAIKSSPSGMATGQYSPPLILFT